MTTLRTAAQQLLGALDKSLYMNDYCGLEVSKHDQPDVTDAIENLRAALAEPVQKPQGCDHCNHWLYAGIKCRMCGRVTEPTTEEPSAVEPVQEPVKPVAWLYRGNLHPFDPSLDRASDPATPLYAHPPQPAEPVQEPAAIVGTQEDTWKGYGGQWAPPGPPIKTVHMLRELPEGTLLYAAPFQRMPLSEDEIFAIENDIPDAVISDRAWTIWLSRAVEAAHGIK